MASKVFTERMTANLTPEQKDAAQAARKAAGYDSDSAMFHDFLAQLCAKHGIDWPEVETPTEGKGKAPWKIGEGGKFVKP
jgi:hypothetical protein